jgi:hypothetical protein
MEIAPPFKKRNVEDLAKSMENTNSTGVFLKSDLGARWMT